MLTEIVEYGHKIEKEVKAMQSEIKENIQGTNSGGDEGGIQINDLEHKEEISIQPEQQEEKRIKNKKQKQKNKDRLTSLWGISTSPHATTSES